MSKSLKRVLVLVLLIIISFMISDNARKIVTNLSIYLVGIYDDTKNSIHDLYVEHFDQRDEIRTLREENKKLNETAGLSIAFAEKLNGFLEEANLTIYEPRVKLVRVISYSTLGDYNKLWVDFEDFNKTKIYGLLYQGYSAGIVAESFDKPQVILQNDAKSTFSVYIGKEKINGITFGVKDHLEVRYIPLWTKPKVDDEVITSGLDDIFFEGVKVGKVVEVLEDGGFFTAVVEPYAVVEIPGFFHVIINN